MRPSDLSSNASWQPAVLRFDTRNHGALADTEGDRIIEVKAYGRTARNSDPWLETRQVEAALRDPERFHLVLGEKVRNGVPIDIHGADLAALLERRRVKRYFSTSPSPHASTTNAGQGPRRDLIDQLSSSPGRGADDPPSEAEPPKLTSSVVPSIWRLFLSRMT